ncbi:hypothetical protein AUJ46_04945 [Candidatus Peregrinibacteria bacterium CG1_02_54_53]|nr:MAG: hypothetical protein AUJ46_04945 [Candidatus Peregrinibacteria bacterium CG1_02_54_53]
MTLFVTMFIAGLITILLPCILPLIPIVVGVSISGRSRWRPLITVFGMLISFVGFTFLLEVFLSQFFEAADILRIATFAVLLLFGIGFLIEWRWLRLLGAFLSGFFFVAKGWIVVSVAAVAGVIAMEIGGRVASALQGFGFRLQGDARTEFGAESHLTALIIGLTMGLVWVPCAGPALGFAFALVREQPGLKALALLATYGAGTAVPLLFVGYGGQWAVHTVRALTRFTGIIERGAGAILIITALGLQFNWFTSLQTLLVQNTDYGITGTELEERLFEKGTESSSSASSADAAAAVSDSSAQAKVVPSLLPRLGREPELSSTGPWHNSEPLTLADLKGKVVLIDFWTYSCINCIRTLPYIKGYWEKYEGKPFVIIGVHTPEFVFEKSETNVRDAIRRHGLKYPVVQDNNFGTWNAFNNHYWPAKYLIDAEGYIRFTHFGEGAYDETDRAIQSLLGEIGVDASGMPVVQEPVGTARRQSPETYLGDRSWDALANAQGRPSSAVTNYVAPDRLPLHSYALVGQWQLVDGERQQLIGKEGEIRLNFLGGEANLVLGLEGDAAPVSATVSVDGKPSTSFTVDRHDLFQLFKGPYGEHSLTLTLNGAGVAGYAFTFGS